MSNQTAGNIDNSASLIAFSLSQVRNSTRLRGDRVFGEKKGKERKEKKRKKHCGLGVAA
jgi:hypothetical protein